MRNRNDTIVQSQSSAAISRGHRTISITRLVATLVSCWLFASPALAGGGIAGGCPTNQPCIELVAVAINGTPITPTSNVTVQPGDEIETNLFISGWGDAIGLMLGYEIEIVWATAASSGLRGTVLPVGWDGPPPISSCNNSGVCPIGSFCVYGMCQGPNYDPGSAVFIDIDRKDYVHRADVGALQITRLGGDFRYELVTVVTSPSQGAVDTGSPAYAGTFLLRASEFACGDFAPFGVSAITLTGLTPATEIAGTASIRINVGDCDCNANGSDDLKEIATGTVADCNNNGVPDECKPDCQSNGIADECDITDGTSMDCDFDIIPDECESQTDCNNNGIRDECEVVGPGANDCDGNGIPDDCDGGSDCNENGMLDSCDIANDTSIDCQSNGVPDECDIALGTSTDNDGSGVPDECETYCAQSACGPGSCLSLKAVAINGNPIEPTNNVTASRGDIIETEIWLSCWGSEVGLLRAYQATIKGSDAVVSGDAGLVLPVGWDAPIQFIPCSFISDCPLGTTCSGGRCAGHHHFPGLGAFVDVNHENYLLRDFERISYVGFATLDYIFGGTATEITGATDAGQPKYGGTLLLSVSDDACGEFMFDFWGDGLLASSVFGSPDPNTGTVVPSLQPLFIQTHDCDCNNNGVLDDEDLATGAASDCNNNNLPDDCDPDCNLNGTPDDCELASCNGDRACGDCNQNGILDSCDIASGTSPDADGNGTPDDCFIAIPTVSEWGLAVLALLLLVTAKLKFGFFEVGRSAHA